MKCLTFFSYRQTKHFITTPIFTKTHKGHLFYALSFTCRKNQVCVYDATDFQ